MNDPESNSSRLDAELKQALAERLGPTERDDAQLIARVRARVLGAIRAEVRPQHRTIRATDAQWELMSPGLERKVLWATPTSLSCMMRLAPGTVVGAHRHPMDEECVVLEGSLRIGQLELREGDFHIGCEGSQHEETTTVTGALVYLRGAAHQVPA